MYCVHQPCCGLQRELIIIAACSLLESTFLILKSLILRKDLPEIQQYLNGHFNNSKKYGFNLEVSEYLWIFSIAAVVVGGMMLLSAKLLLISVCRNSIKLNGERNRRWSLLLFGVARCIFMLFCFTCVILIACVFDHPSEQIPWLSSLSLFTMLSVYFIPVVALYYKLLRSSIKTKEQYQITFKRNSIVPQIKAEKYRSV